MMIFVPLYLNSLVLITLLQETTTAFDDLGTLLLGGVTAAIVLAVAFVLIKFRLQDKKEDSNKSTRIFTD